MQDDSVQESTKMSARGAPVTLDPVQPPLWNQNAIPEQLTQLKVKHNQARGGQATSNICRANTAAAKHHNADLAAEQTKILSTANLHIPCTPNSWLELSDDGHETNTRVASAVFPSPHR